MSNVLVRIKRAVLRGRIRLTEKAIIEMQLDDLSREDIAESILNAESIFKTLRSTSPARARSREYLYIIRSYTLDGVLIYSKGKLAGPPDDE